MSENSENTSDATPSEPADSNLSGSTAPESDIQSQKLKDLEAAVAQLQAENQQLRAGATTAQHTENFFKGLSQGINQVINKTKSEKGLEPTKKLQFMIDPDLPHCFEQLQPHVKTNNCGPEISEAVAQLLEQCWHHPFSKEEIVEALDQQVRPRNAIAVKPLEVNPEIQLSKQERANEKDLHYIGNAVCAAGKCLAYLMDMLADAEIILRRDYPDDHGWLVWDDFTFDFAKANKLIASAINVGHGQRANRPSTQTSLGK